MHDSILVSFLKRALPLLLFLAIGWAAQTPGQLGVPEHAGRLVDHVALLWTQSHGRSTS